MRKYLLVVLVTTSLFSSPVIGQVRMPAPSTTQTIKQEFGIGTIELVYSRPNMKGRKAFMDKSELAPIGEVWRTGANAATRIHFSDKVSIGGHDLDSGSYAIYTIPNKNEWTIIINKGDKDWGTEYKPDWDLFRFKVPVMKYPVHVETFTMNFQNIKNESCDLRLIWGMTAVNIPITTKIMDRLRASIESALQGEKKPYQAAANFYYDMDKNYPKALENVNQAISMNDKAFWLYLLKARIQKDMGDKAGAKVSAQKTIVLATEQKNNDYVRMANQLIASL
ncbi:MAG: DUF2911 domain-containing protein [Ginsengibacter sp.]